MSAATLEKCPKCGAEDHSVSGSGFTEYACGTRIKPTDPWVQSSYMCLRNQRDQLAERVKELEDEVADYMKLFCDWNAYASNLESVGRQMLDGGFHAPHIISQWREAENTRP